MLKRLLQVSASLALLALAASTVVMCADVHELAKSATIALRDLDETVKQQNVQLAQDELHLDQVLTGLDSTVTELNIAAKEQQSYWAKTSADSDKTVKALRLTTDRLALLLQHTDQELNFTLLPNLDRQITSTAQGAQLSLASLTHASDALTFQINDVGPILTSLGESSAQLAQASGHANKILADGEHTADYYEKKLTTPASFAKRLGMTLLDVGSKLGNIMAGFVK